MSKTLLTPATMTGYTPHSDNTMTFRFRSQDLTSEQKMDVITHYQQFGWLGFVDSEDATDLEIPDIKPSKLDGKSPSQRLRAVVFISWQQKGSKGSFESYYEQYINAIIETAKSKLDD